MIQLCQDECFCFKDIKNFNDYEAVHFFNKNKHSFTTC